MICITYIHSPTHSYAYSACLWAYLLKHGCNFEVIQQGQEEYQVTVSKQFASLPPQACGGQLNCPALTYCYILIVCEQDKDYCVLTMPHLVPEFPLLQSFIVSSLYLLP